MNRIMDRSTTSVKTRAYDVSGRRARAERTRAVVLDVALDRFLIDGYAATTVESIADDVPVSVGTIYKGFGGKSGLVRALCERALEGTGPEPAEQRSDTLQATEPDPYAIIEGWGRLVAEVSPRVAPVVLLLRDAAATNVDAAALAAEFDTNRLDRMAHNAHTIANSGHLQPGLTHSDIRDTLWFFSAPELYDLLVQRRGWETTKYAEFVTNGMTRALLR